MFWLTNSPLIRSVAWELLSLIQVSYTRVLRTLKLVAFASLVLICMRFAIMSSLFELQKRTKLIRPLNGSESSFCCV